MKKIVFILLIPVLLAACTTIPLPTEPGRRFAVEYFPYCPDFETLFNNKTETLVFVSSSGKTVTFSNYQIQVVNFKGGKYWIEPLKKDLMRYGITLANVVLVIHNHYITKNFSDGDLYVLSVLRRHGLKGMFAIYFVPTKEIIGIKNEPF